MLRLCKPDSFNPCFITVLQYRSTFRICGIQKILIAYLIAGYVSCEEPTEGGMFHYDVGDECQSRDGGTLPKHR